DAVDKKPDDPGGRRGDRHRQEDHRLHDRLVADLVSEHRDHDADRKDKRGVDDEPEDVVDDRATGRELAEIEEVRVGREQTPKVIEPDEGREVESLPTVET